MSVRYNKLWKISIDGKIKKKDLQEAAHFAHYQMMKLTRDDSPIANDSVATNFDQIFATYSPDTVGKVL